VFPQAPSDKAIAPVLVTPSDKAIDPVLVTPTEAIAPVLVFRAAVTKSQARTLVDALRDPFDANRQLCLDLLLQLDLTQTGFQVSFNLYNY